MPNPSASTFLGRLFLRRLCLALLCWLPVVSQAVVVEGLYEAARPVADQGEEERGRAFEEGLSEILIRIAGSVEVVALEGVRKALADPMALVQQYRYEQYETRQGTPGLRFYMVFDPAAVQALLEGQGLPVWGRERPATLIWLAVDDGRRRLVSREDGGRYLRILEQAAQRRGVPLLFPLLDLEERRAVTVSDIWGGFGDAPVQASGRYGTASVLMIRLQREDERWRAQWTQQAFGETRSWKTAGDLRRTLNAGVDHLAEGLAERFVVAGGAVDVRLEVAAVDDLAGYGRLMGYLRGLSPVGELRLLRVSATGLTLSARVRGGAAALEPVIGLGRVLSLVVDEELDDVLRYRLEAD